MNSDEERRRASAQDVVRRRRRLAVATANRIYNARRKATSDMYSGMSSERGISDFDEISSVARIIEKVLVKAERSARGRLDKR